MGASRVLTNGFQGSVSIQTTGNGIINLSSTPDLVGASGEYSNTIQDGPGDPIGLITPAVVPQGTGKFLIWGIMAARATAAQVVVIKLAVDGAQVAIGNISTIVSQEWSITLFAAVQVVPTVTHLFSIEAKGAAGTNNTAAIGFEKIMWQEQSR